MIRDADEYYIVLLAQIVHTRLLVLLPEEVLPLDYNEHSHCTTVLNYTAQVL
jgi:hypothetical protein